MTSRIDLSVSSQNPVAIQNLRQVIRRYEESHRSSVQLTVFGWDTIWKDMVNIGIYKRGADLSEVGTTWIGSFVSMNALRPYKPAEIEHIGGEKVFLPTAWQTTSLVGDGRVWAIPFLSDVRVIFYWHDMLEKARVDETTAFASFEGMETAFSRLKKRNGPAPWAVPTDASTQDTLHNASSWVWAVGGDFVSPDGRKTRFTDPGVLAALKAYFGLHRFMPQGIHPLSGQQTVEMFRQRQVAAILCGPWLLPYLRRQAGFAGQKTQIGIALPPGPSFVGGANFIVWRHARNESECIELIRYLVLPQTQIEFCPSSGLLPVRMEALIDPLYTNDVHNRVLVEALQKGRVPTPFALWGMVEDKLSISFTQVWSDIYARPADNLDAILSRHLEGLARRLDIMLGS
jgi:ABC-type glycerol-3-phosphate transport system substrate-binding protein